MADLGRELSRHPAPHPPEHILSPLSVRRANVSSTAFVRLGVMVNIFHGVCNPAPRGIKSSLRPFFQSLPFIYSSVLLTSFYSYFQSIL